MLIGVPKEIKTNESRVAMTPQGVTAFTSEGHTVLVQKGAGGGSGITDAEYTAAGALIADSAEEVFAAAEMIVKVKEPQKNEIAMIREDQIVYTYLHYAADKALTEGMLARKAISIAYETIEVGGKLPLLEPMSEIAGKMSAIMGAYYSARPYGGAGVLPGGVPGVHAGRFVVIGGGTAGTNAAKIAAGLGARVVIMDINLERLRYLADILPSNVETIYSNKHNIEKEVSDADVVICTVLIPGAKAPRLITRDTLKKMKDGAVIVDVSIDQGGCTETSRPTTHENPVYFEEGVAHYCVANMPGAYAHTSTFALTNATLPFGLRIARHGWLHAAKNDRSIALGINTVGDRITCKPVAEAHGLGCTPLEDIIGQM